MAKDIMELAKEKLQSLAKKGEGGGSDDPSVFKPKNGNQDIRVTPSSDGDNFQERFLHYSLGAPFLCPKRNFGEKCAVCDFASSLFVENTKESREQSKKIYAKPRYFSPVLVRGEEDKGIRWWQYGKTVYKSMLNLVLNPKYGNFTDMKKGFDFTLTYTPAQSADEFPKTELLPDPSSFNTPMLKDQKKAEELVEKMPKLIDILSRVTSAETKQRLDDYLAGGGDSVEKYGVATKSNIDTAFEDLKDE